MPSKALWEIQPCAIIGNAGLPVSYQKGPPKFLCVCGLCVCAAPVHVQSDAKMIFTVKCFVHKTYPIFI